MEIKGTWLENVSGKCLMLRRLRDASNWVKDLFSFPPL